MKTFILITDIICVLISLYIIIDIIVFINKNSKIKSIKKQLGTKLILLRVLTFLLIIINLILIFNNIYSFLE